jgi:hypothetical protein
VLRLDQVRDIVDERLDSGDLRAVLRLRQAEIESQILESRTSRRLKTATHERYDDRLIPTKDTAADDVTAVTATGVCCPMPGEAKE